MGVEIDPSVMRAARDHFDLDALEVEGVLADALTFLREDRGRYDAILEDIFVGAGDAVYKPGWLPRPGLELAAARLRKGGVLVSNTLDEARQMSRTLREIFPRALRIDIEDYDNRIFAAGYGLGSAADLRTAVEGSTVLRESARCLSFRTLRPLERATPARRGTASRPG